MSATPIGWGFPGPRRAAAPVATTQPRSRISNGSQRLMHMRFALWANALDHAPKPGETCDQLGINYETARRLLADWKQLTEVNP